MCVENVILVSSTRLFAACVCVRVCVSCISGWWLIALLHRSVTGHNRQIKLFRASSDSDPFVLPQIPSTERITHSPHWVRTYGIISVSERAIPIPSTIPLNFSLLWSTLAFSSNKKAVLIKFLSLVLAELRGEKEHCLLSTTVLEKFTGYQEPEFHTLLYPSQKKKKKKIAFFM